MTEHKYGVPDDHWDEDDDQTDADPTPRVEVNAHSVTIDHVVDERYVERYRYRFAIEAGTIVGWSRTDIEPNGTEDYNPVESWDKIPTVVRNTLADELDVRELDLDVPAYMEADDE